MKAFDLIVIGAGSGLNLAVEAAQHGIKTAIIEEGPLGGTCLNRGCIPSKMILHSADVADTIRNSTLFGINSTLKINFKKVTERATKLVDFESKEIEKNLLLNKKPVLFKGRAKFIGPKAVMVNGEEIIGNKFVIAIGTRTLIPPIQGLDKVLYLTSTEALRLTTLPKSMIIIGGGYIGAELGYFYASMGCKITILQRNQFLIPNADAEVAELFTKIWKKRYNIITGVEVNKVEKSGKNIAVYYNGSNSKKVMAEKILLATGRKPNTDWLDLNKCGVKLSKWGYVIVNPFMETNVRNIWALGDAAGVYQFKHSANLEAETVLNNILNTKKPINYYPMPWAIFTNPQVAGVGLTEQEAIDARKDIVVGRYFYKDTGMGSALEEKDGFVKLIVERKTKEILGCHIIGPHASILIHEVVVAMKADKLKALDLLRNTVHVHPALSEVVQRAARSVRV